LITRRQFLKGCASSLLAISVAELMWQMPSSCGTADQQIPVLLYHRVGQTVDPLTVTPDRFERDLRQLKKAGYSTIGLRQFERFLADRDTELPAKPLLITFDDGYLDNFLLVYPILKKYGMKGTIFVNSDFAVKENILRKKENGIAGFISLISFSGIIQLSIFTPSVLSVSPR